MKLIFSAKEENNERRKKAFLVLSPIERLESFLRMVSEFQALPLKGGLEHKNDKKGNFILTKSSGKTNKK